MFSFLGPPGVGKTHLAQAVGYEAIKMNFQVLYRSIFDLVRDFMKDEAFNQQDRTLRCYLKPELLIIDDFGLKQLCKNSGEHQPAPSRWTSKKVGRSLSSTARNRISFVMVSIAINRPDEHCRHRKTVVAERPAMYPRRLGLSNTAPKL
jgi:hypothetical protein